MGESVVLITGGTGSLGTSLTKRLLSEGHKVRVFARNEHQHERLASEIPTPHLERFSSLIGDVRDLRRLKRAAEGADLLIHAAAQKIIPLAEYDPMEAVKTNILGTMNAAEVALDCGIKRAVLVSTDKASSPINLYGATKLAAERLWLNSNRYCGGKGGKFVACRYGNVFGSRGSVIHVFTEQAKSNRLRVTDTNMTRFHIRLDQAVDFVLRVSKEAEPGQLWVPKLRAYGLMDLARVVAPQAHIEITGRRPGEKLAETMISENESCYVVDDAEDHYALEFSETHQDGGWEYSSDHAFQTPRMTREEIKKEIEGLWEKRS